MCYLFDNWHKFVFVILLFSGYAFASSWYLNQTQLEKTDQSIKQLSDDTGQVRQQDQQRQLLENNTYVLGWLIVGVVVFLVFIGDLRKMFKQTSAAILAITMLTCGSGCRRPMEPIILVTIESYEEAFMIPYTGDGSKQDSSNNEEFLKKNLVYTKQIKIPQQWVLKGYETFGYNGTWEPAAKLIKVDRSQITREWTADPNTGTSNKNEAIWVMTSDQVEFSTGWMCTAVIDSRDDAIKFLHHYPNGSLMKTLDTEVRAKLQTVFGLEVTDLPMEELRKAATPHIEKTVKTVKDFFKEKGITVTNLGISGGFIYKDKSIMDTMVKLFNTEQDKAVAIAEAAAQKERNFKVISDAQGKADAKLKLAKAEADAIKMQADAKLYEMEKSKENLESYVALKRLELQKELLQKWDGRYPVYFMATGGQGPNMLLQLPVMEAAPPKK